MERIEEDILKTIARTTPHSYKNLEDVYSGSVDVLLRAIYRSRENNESLEYAYEQEWISDDYEQEWILDDYNY